jgi:hypothetical protein
MTNGALSSAHRRRAALPAGVTCLMLADAAGIDLRRRTFVRLGPRRFLLRHRIRPLNGTRTPLPSSQSMSRMSRRWCSRRVPHIDRERDRLSDASCDSQPSRSRELCERLLGGSGPDRFSGRFRCAELVVRSSLVNKRTGVGPVRNRVLSGLAQDPRPLRSRVVQQMLLN